MNKNSFNAFAAIILATLAFSAKAVECEKFAHELSVMRAADQAVRILGGENSDDMRRINNIVDAVDKSNTRRAKDFLAKCGWPFASKFGPQVSSDMWVIVQHADLDRKFQRATLPMLRQAVELGEAREIDLAYLTDRIAVADGKTQPYGTQIAEWKGCNPVLARIDSRAAVDIRRSSIKGMQTLDEYEAWASKHISPQNCRAN